MPPSKPDEGESKTAADHLRSNAEERLTAAKKTELNQSHPKWDSQRLQYELEIHQCELKMQNAELIHARDEADIALDKFADLFETGPVGFLTLTRDGVIKAISLNSVSFLGKNRSELLGKRFGMFVASESRPAFADLLDKTFADRAKVVCDVAILTKGDTPVFVQLASMVVPSGQECNVALIDITERKRAEEALKQHAARLIMLEEDLRKRIAADLHDDIAQALTALGLNLTHVSNHLKGESSDSGLYGILENSRKLTKEVSRSVRNLMVDLYSHQLEDFGLGAALSSHVEQYSSRAGTEAVFDADPNFPRLAAKKETALFRITQEALQNILKHADAKKVTITLSNSGGVVRLTVTDDGKGFLPQEALPQPFGAGWGLRNMRERAELIGGSFRVHSVVGEGTTIEVEIKAAG